MAKRKTTNLQDKVTFRLDAKHLEELEDYADQQGVTVSFVVRHLVSRFLEEQRLYPQYGRNTMPRISGF
jgi:antitoxin component of RelBE/YafQ-DinJ toxin-antitoxin module